MIAYYQKQELTKTAIKDWIVKNLQDRKSELSLFSVAFDFDTDMLKSMIASGSLKTFLSSKS